MLKRSHPKREYLLNSGYKHIYADIYIYIYSSIIRHIYEYSPFIYDSFHLYIKINYIMRMINIEIQRLHCKLEANLLAYT